MTADDPTLISDMIGQLQAKVAAMPVVPQPAACGTCDGTRWATREIDGVQRAVRCPACTVTDAIPPTLPYEFRDARLSNYEDLPGNAAAIRAARKFIEAASGDLYLYGDVGTGKSRLAASILADHYRSTKTGIFARVPRLLHDLQPHTHAEVVRAEFERSVTTVPLLVLDDIGSERDEATDFTRRTLLLIYESRGDAGLRTIWTSNHSIQKLGNFLDDERLVSRINGRSEVVELTTQDQRYARRRR